MVEIQTILTYLTLISVPVGVFYHIMTLNNSRKTQELTLKAQQQQLETRQAQLFMQIFNHYVSSDFRDALNEIERWEWTNFEEYWAKYGAPKRYPDNYNTFSKVGMFYEGLGTLVREDLIDIGMIQQFFGGVFIEWFEKWKPCFDGIIQMYDDVNRPPRVWNTSYLYEQMIKYRDENPELFT